MSLMRLGIALLAAAGERQKESEPCDARKGKCSHCDRHFILDWLKSSKGGGYSRSPTINHPSRILNCTIALNQFRVMVSS